jgi:hypothetical protein
VPGDVVATKQEADKANDQVPGDVVATKQEADTVKANDQVPGADVAPVKQGKDAAFEQRIEELNRKFDEMDRNLGVEPAAADTKKTDVSHPMASSFDNARATSLAVKADDVAPVKQEKDDAFEQRSEELNKKFDEMDRNLGVEPPTAKSDQQREMQQQQQQQQQQQRQEQEYREKREKEQKRGVARIM